MHQQAMIDLATWDTQITTLVTRDDFFTSQPPLTRSIELLIHPSIKPECLLAHIALKLEVLEAFLKRLNTSELRVAPNPHLSRWLISHKIKLIVQNTTDTGRYREVSALSSRVCATLPMRLPMAFLEFFIGNRSQPRISTHGFEGVDIQLFYLLLPLELLLLHFHQLDFMPHALLLKAFTS